MLPHACHLSAEGKLFCLLAYSSSLLHFDLRICTYNLLTNGPFSFQVLKTLVHFGAPPKILVDGKPHLGTDRLVPLLRNFRQHLKELGVSDSIYCVMCCCRTFSLSCYFSF